jgi:flavorubredoxin
MKVAVRYFSKFGHSAQMATVVGEVLGVKPESTEVLISEPVDTLYVGSGVLMGKISNNMAEFLRSLTPEMVDRVVCFGSSAIISSPVPQMRKLLEDKGITVDERSFTCRGSMGPIHAGHPNQKDIADLKEFIEQTK